MSIPEIAATPANNANVTTTSNVPVFGVDLKAIGSDMLVTSAKVQLTDIKAQATANAVTEHPATLVQNLYVYDGSTLLGTYPVNTNTVVKDGSNYYVILSGFKFVVPVNTIKTLTVDADFAPGLETSRQLTVNLYGADAIRAVDGSGAYTTLGGDQISATLSGSGSTLAAGANLSDLRQFTVTYNTVGTSILTVAADTSTPISTSVNVNATSGTTNVPMLLVDAKSTTGASQITDMTFTATGSGISYMNAVNLYDGSTLLGSASLNGSHQAIFHNLTINVAQDATKQLTLSSNFAVVPSNGLTVSLGIATPSSDVTFNTPNLSSAHPTSGAVAGSTMYLYNGISADLSFTNATSTYSYNSTSPSLSYTTGVITFKAHADGGTLLALTNSLANSKVIVGYNAGSGSGTLASSAVNVDFAPVGGIDGNAINDGGDAIVTVTVTMPRSVSSTGFLNFYISEIDWNVGGSIIGGVVTGGANGSATYASGQLSNYKTPYANVQ